jgi:spore photoproduct lyase
MELEPVRHIRHVVADQEVLDTRVAAGVRAGLPEAEWHVRGPEEPFPLSGQDKNILYLKRYRGRFLRFCPGTSKYRCCGYRIVHIGENCPLSCTYCILRAYFQDNVLKVWANQEDLWRELDQEIGGRPDRLFRVGTGEFTDSLALEPLTAYSRDLIAFLAKYDNCCLELKTKTSDLSWMESVSRPERVLPAWSVNSPEVVGSEEKGAAGLEQRLAAARKCAENGFRVCLHFDPVLRYPGWERGYDTAVDMIRDYLRPRDIAYISLGSFRCMPELLRRLGDSGERRDFLEQEFVTGLDGKLRLLRPLRVAQFRRIADRLKSHGIGEQLYFCMESDEVWRDVLGYTPKDLGGLANHLLRRAFPFRD